MLVPVALVPAAVRVGCTILPMRSLLALGCCAAWLASGLTAGTVHVHEAAGHHQPVILQVAGLQRPQLAAHVVGEVGDSVDRSVHDLLIVPAGPG